ncbi:aminoglycoside phosphotransferase family protein [Paenibacillus albiflavus]|uniref:Aminoglycoside phosphotransferase family protein n=1 Tax=Paenibacillus albiflavus TaxID=2545760 RepID=A0A4R4EGW6_9BACL|nr:aminoglycoside phosphotransferase family protein [Paenibacillus albiflavus]TCZ79344.1 aminoglycoside phosphotransferase family protein [Paenibacillus albiflavus]
MNYQYNIKFERLCNELNLGEILKEPETISGGLLHRMFSVETTNGKYAIKALNPQIMARPTALNNYHRSERIANIAANELSVQPAKIIEGKFIQSIDDQYYLIFDWIEGISLKSSEINNVHCERIGLILADIHKTDFSQIILTDNYLDNTAEIDWNFYLSKGREIDSEWVDLLQENIDQIFVWSAKAKRSSIMLSAEKVISHRDLEPKNVMWVQENPIIIDWESADYINPKHDLIETAIYWSVNELGKIDKDKFLAFIYGYQKQYGVLESDWNLILELGYLSKLDWLEYSLKRSLWIECADEKEQQMGTIQVTGTINAIKQYENIISDLVKWLNNDINKVVK